MNDFVKRAKKHVNKPIKEKETYEQLSSFFCVFFTNDLVKRAKKHVNKPIKEKDTYEQLSLFFFIFFTNDFLKRAKTLQKLIDTHSQFFS